MKLLPYFALFFSLTGFIISCETENNNDPKSDITGQLTSISDCKYDLKSTEPEADTPDSLSCVKYAYDRENKKLTLKHINAGFNCCPDSSYCKIELIDDVIQVQEFEKTPQCHCNCLYDLDIEINEVALGSYKIEFIEPYVEDQTKLIVEIDLNKSSDGSFCVTRKLYPWGLISLNE